MHQYKSHPIYGIAIAGLTKEWHGRGLIFDADDKVTEIKRLECAEPIFASKKLAEEHGLKQCKKWLDDQDDNTESSSPTNSAPMKPSALAI